MPKPSATPPLPEHAASTLEQMAQVVLSDHSLDEIFELVVSLPSAAFSGVAGTSVTLTDKASPYTSVATGPLPRALDEVQYSTNEGPCLEAARSSTMTVIGSVTEDERFPKFTPAALEHGVHSVLSLPLVTGERSIGSLNIYGHAERTFGGQEQLIGSLFAQRASILVTNARALDEARALAEQLQEAVGTREVIGEAKGILMEREACTSDEAFDLLKKASQNTNTKLRDIAEQVVLGAVQ